MRGYVTAVRHELRPNGPPDTSGRAVHLTGLGGRTHEFLVACGATRRPRADVSRGDKHSRFAPRFGEVLSFPDRADPVNVFGAAA
jgi:hypothetical protein